MNDNIRSERDTVTLRSLLVFLFYKWALQSGRLGVEQAVEFRGKLALIPLGLQ